MNSLYVKDGKITTEPVSSSLGYFGPFAYVRFADNGKRWLGRVEEEVEGSALTFKKLYINGELFWQGYDIIVIEFTQDYIIIATDNPYSPDSIVVFYAFGASVPYSYTNLKVHKDQKGRKIVIED